MVVAVVVVEETERVTKDPGRRQGREEVSRSACDDFVVVVVGHPARVRHVDTA